MPQLTGKDHHGHTKRHFARIPRQIPPILDRECRLNRHNAPKTHRANTKLRRGSKTQARSNSLSELAKKFVVGFKNFVSNTLKLVANTRGFRFTNISSHLSPLFGRKLFNFFNDFSGAHPINLLEFNLSSKRSAKKKGKLQSNRIAPKTHLSTNLLRPFSASFLARTAYGPAVAIQRGNARGLRQCAPGARC